MICLIVDFFAFILFGILLASWIYRYVSCHILEFFSRQFLSTFQPSSLSSVLCYSDTMDVRSSAMVPQILKVLVCFFSIVCFVVFLSLFSLFIKLGNFYCSLLQFTDLYSVPFNTSVISVISVLVICVSQHSPEKQTNRIEVLFTYIIRPSWASGAHEVWEQSARISLTWEKTGLFVLVRPLAVWMRPTTPWPTTIYQ